MNREPFQNEEYYHVYNRGTDKRRIFMNYNDINRFLKCMDVFNTVDPVGSLWLHGLNEEPKKKTKHLVDIVAFCLNPNHYHFILKQNINHGIPEFMKRLNGGYTNYFNFRTKRTGALFQGAFKSKHIFDNDYLLHVSAYVNLNDRVHQLRSETPQLVRSSWSEYIGSVKYLCRTEIILKQFKNKKAYETFALEALPVMLQRKQDEKEIASLLME